MAEHRRDEGVFRHMVLLREMRWLSILSRCTMDEGKPF
jgi:hypothetical protein